MIGKSVRANVLKAGGVEFKWTRSTPRASFFYEPGGTRAPQFDVAGFAYAELAGDPPLDLIEATAPDRTTV